MIKSDLAALYTVYKLKDLAAKEDERSPKWEVALRIIHRDH
jgi:hypothetical protein